MGDHSAIEWTDATWNPTVGCDKVSAGCQRCYAITQAYRLEHGFKQPAYQGLTRKLPDSSINWTGVVRTLPERLVVPLTWKKPARIFVDSMSDLFHEDVPDEFIDQVFGIMALTERHTYQVLTKRPERLRAYMTNPETPKRIGSYMTLGTILMTPGTMDAAGEEMARWKWLGVRWPLKSVWLGTSVEDQRAADERIPLLLQTPAAVRFLSCEPLLGLIDLRHVRYDDVPTMIDAITGRNGVFEPYAGRGPHVNWVIAGGESGPKARPCDPAWVRSLRDQCQAAPGVAFYFKQWGGRTHVAGGRLLDGRTHDDFPQAAREVAHA